MKYTKVNMSGWSNYLFMSTNQCYLLEYIVPWAETTFDAVGRNSNIRQGSWSAKQTATTTGAG